MPDFIWSFKNLRVQASQGTLTDVMVAVGYRLCCTDRYRAVYRYGDIDFAPANSEQFTPFEQISESVMVAFAEQALAAELDSIKQAMLSELSEPPIDIRPMPWESAKETEQ
jgi:hypothetical protein